MILCAQLMKWSRDLLIERVEFERAWPKDENPGKPLLLIRLRITVALSGRDYACSAA